MNEQTKTENIDRWRDSVSGIMFAAKSLLKAKKEMPNESLINFIRLKTGLDFSAAGKLMRVGSHHILADRKNFDKLPASWAFLYEASFLPDDFLTAAIESGEILKMTKYDIWHARGKQEDSARVRRGNNGVKGGAGNQREGGTVKIPAGESLEGVIRRGMKLEEEGFIAVDAAKQIGIGVATYRMVRMAIMLSTHEYISDDDKAIVIKVLREMNRTKNVRRYYALLEPIVTKVFGSERNQKFDDERVQKRIQKFRGAIVIIQDTCVGGVELDTPPLPPEVKAEILDRLVKAREAIGQIKGKVLKAND